MSFWIYPESKHMFRTLKVKMLIFPDGYLPSGAYSAIYLHANARSCSSETLEAGHSVRNKRSSERRRGTEDIHPGGMADEVAPGLWLAVLPSG